MPKSKYGYLDRWAADTYAAHANYTITTSGNTTIWAGPPNSFPPPPAKPKDDALSWLDRRVEEVTEKAFVGAG